MYMLNFSKAISLVQNKYFFFENKIIQTIILLQIRPVIYSTEFAFVSNVITMNSFHLN